MIPRPRIYISSPVSVNLTLDQKEFKKEVLSRVALSGFEAQEFHSSGLPRGDNWTFDRARDLMSRCQGAIIFAFAQWEDNRKITPVVMPTEYTHLEGAIALTLDKQTLIIKDEQVADRGIASFANGHYILSRPLSAGPEWAHSEDFELHYSNWHDKIRQRRHIFFGYCGKAADTALRIIRFLHSIGVAVRDWQVDFMLAGVILDEIEESAKTCLGGIFLFTKDDEFMNGDAMHAAPRDNVVFEAGFFMHAVGRKRTLIIREEGAKMPADLGGGIYLSLADRTNTATIETQLRNFIESRL